MTAPVDILLTVNGEPVEARVLPRTHLADFLREELGLTGTHTGCEQASAAPVRSGSTARSCAAASSSPSRRRARAWRPSRASPTPARSPTCRRVPGAQRAAVRLLHAGHAARRAGPPRPRAGPEPRRDPRAPLGQLLPLHRLPGDRRRGRDRGEAAAGEKPMSDDDAARPFRARPAEHLYRPLGAAPEPRAPRAGEGAIRQRHGAAAHGPRRFRALAPCPCAHPSRSMRARREPRRASSPS